LSLLMPLLSPIYTLFPYTTLFRISHYNDVWRTYHHHIEIFYDFLHLNRELRDLDFKHNYEEKQKIVERAEALVAVEDLNTAFQEDRKSTRLNSSHVKISYAVFCLKK